MSDRVADTFRILVSTDNHLGYAEKDPIRGEDSFRTFGEILQLARHEHVDLLLLAGDLFHENKPSRKTMYQTLSLLRTYCMGDGAIPFQIVSDQSINFPNFGMVNYEHPHYNIELPIFSIHGNHDDPSREGTTISQSLAALDIVSAANLINYFGKSETVDAIEVFPILMIKGKTQIALYGLGNIREERLYRLFEQNKVVFRRPAEQPETWFNIFIVHQNRENRGRGRKNALSESFIPSFIDFVIWGHEHECNIEQEKSVHGDFYITQPGSSVATSLVEGEAKTKQVSILEIHQQQFRMSHRILHTVRPFHIGEVCLSDMSQLDPNDPDITERIRHVLEEKVIELLSQVNQKEELQPLIRLRVEHSGFPLLHNQRFGARFVGKVANPNDILLFYRRKTKQTSTKEVVVPSVLRDPIRPTRLDTVTIEDLLSKQLHLPTQSLVFLPEKPLSNALEDYVFRNIPSALDVFVENLLETTQRELKATKGTRSKQDIIDAVEKKKELVDATHAVAQEEDSVDPTSVLLGTRRRVDSFEDDDEDLSATASTASNRTVSKSRFGTPRSTKMPLTKRQTKATPTPSTPSPVRPKRPARAAVLKAKSSPSDEDIGGDGSDNDEDFEVKEEEVEDEDEDEDVAPKSKRGSGGWKKTLTKQVTSSRKTPASKKRVQESIDLVSSESDQEPVKRHIRQSSIRDLFKPTPSIHEDVEEDTTFTQVMESTQSSQSSQVKRRKLPLSMLTSSQASIPIKKDIETSSRRKGWGRTRR